MQIADSRVALFHYTLTDDRGTVLDTSRQREPLAYLHGAGGIVPGLEKALAGKQAGDAFNVDVSAVEGYGLRIEALIQTVPRSAFQGVKSLKVGMKFQAESNMGPTTVVVTAVEGDQVTVDGNHPLAGENLHFAIEITEVRSATAEEMMHGHVHGAGGHHH